MYLTNIALCYQNSTMMEKKRFNQDINVIGVGVENFPEGIAQAFEKLNNMLQPRERIYYGISYCGKNGMTYIAAAEEKYEGEGKQHGLEAYTIEKGEYLSDSITEWLDNTGEIRNTFEKLGKMGLAEEGKPIVEVYWNMSEMDCMVKIDVRKEMQQELESTVKEVKDIIASLDEESLNKIPSEGSWSAGQVVQHVSKVNKSFGRLIHGECTGTERLADDKVDLLRQTFSDLTAKREAPERVRPEERTFTKEELLKALEETTATIVSSIQTLEMDKTCTLFEMPRYGYLTRTEAVWFVIYHTQRHVKQLERMQETEYRRQKEESGV